MRESRPTPDRQDQFGRRLRLLNRLVVGGSALFVLLYAAVRLTGGSAQRLEQLPDLLSRVKTPIVWEVPEDGVKYLQFYHGEPRPEHKFVLVQVRMQARMKIGYPVVPRCFRLVDDEDRRYYPLTHSPLFIHRSDRFYLDRDERLDDELVFEIPAARAADRLLFERYQEPTPNPGGKDHATR
ncbi:MAG: hypothetical protein ABIL09_09875 [Gemmatimonadota bacterium]